MSISRTALAAAALLSPFPAQAQSLKLEPYAFKLADASSITAERGRFTVSEDRRDPRARQIEIGFVRFRSTNPNPGAPIVYLAGGPGGSGVATARGPRQPIFLALRQVADVIAFDQRGTGFSNHIPGCSAEAPLDATKTLNEATLAEYYRRGLETCVARWRAAGVAVKGYTTEQSADDVEALRKALGVPKLDLWGISYGTHLAMAIMRKYPASVGRVALASVEGMDQTVKLPLRAEAAIRRIDGHVQADLVEQMKRVHAKYDAAPQTLSGKTADGAFSFRMDSFPLRLMAGFVAKNPDGIPQLAGGYAALDAGQTERLAPLLYDQFYGQKPSFGMGELMDIASGVSPSRLAQVRRQQSEAVTGVALNFPMPQLRGAIPGLDLGERFRREIKSAHPALIISGDLDVRTPLEEQKEATAGLARAHQVIVRNGGHDLFEAHPDVPKLLIDFFAGRPVSTTELSLPAPGGRR